MKNLLIITQKVDQNDDVLGFFHEWIREFSKVWDKVTVICLWKGEHNLPANVKVLSLGKEKYSHYPHVVRKLTSLFNFYKYIWNERRNYDAVFVHMNPKYIPLGWPVWKLYGKTVSLWYAHGHVPFLLRIADKLVDVAFASTPEGYRLKSKKLKIVGQGIDISKFKIQNSKFKTNENEVFKIISVGRISSSKDYETLIKAAEILKEDDIKFQIEIAGQPAAESDLQYFEKLKKSVKDKRMADVFKFIGPIANKNLPFFLQSADLFMNMSHTGSLDKAVLEAMACGLPILTCNEAYENVLGGYKELLMYPKKDFRRLSEKIKYFVDAGEEKKIISEYLRTIVVRDHNLENLADKISDTLLNL